MMRRSLVLGISVALGCAPLAAADSPYTLQPTRVQEKYGTLGCVPVGLGEGSDVVARCALVGTVLLHEDDLAPFAVPPGHRAQVEAVASEGIAAGHVAEVRSTGGVLVHLARWSAHGQLEIAEHATALEKQLTVRGLARTGAALLTPTYPDDARAPGQSAKPPWYSAKLWRTDGTIAVLPLPASSPPESFVRATGISDDADVVGSVADPFDGERPLLFPRADTGAAPLFVAGLRGSTHGRATAISHSGEFVVGWAEVAGDRVPVRYHRHGPATELLATLGADVGLPVGVNDHGVVLTPTHLIRDGVATALATLSGGGKVRGVAIDDDGRILVSLQDRAGLPALLLPAPTTPERHR